MMNSHSQPCFGYGRPISSEEKRVLDQSKSLLSLLTQLNFEKIKDEIVQTIKASPSAFVIKSLVYCILDMVIMVENAYVLLARLSVELFHALPQFLSEDDESPQMTTFEILLLCKCRMFLENSSPVFAEESNCWRFIKTLLVLAHIFNQTSLVQLQVAELENKDQVTLGNKEAEKDDTFESQKHQDELSLALRKDIEYALVDTERERTEKSLLHQLDLEGKYKGELEATKQLLETCSIEQESLNLQVRAWQDKFKRKYKSELILRKALSRRKQELEIVNGLLESYEREADEMRQERDNALKLVQEELTRKQTEERRQPLPSFFCPITQEVMKDPHMTADGYTYEAEAIREWFSKGHDTSPMTNLKLRHRNLVPNRTLRSAIQEFL